MDSKKNVLTDDQIITERNLIPDQKSMPNNLSKTYVAVVGEGGDSSDSSDSYSANHLTLKSTYSIVNGEGSDGDTDGSESDGEDARF